MYKHAFAIEIEDLLRTYISEKVFIHSADGIEINPFMYIGMLIGYLASNNALILEECDNFIYDIYSKYHQEYFDKSSNEFDSADEILTQLKNFIEGK